MRGSPKQTKNPHRLPRALTGHAGYLAVRLGQDAQRRFENAVAELDLRPAEYDYLSAVAEFGPLSQRDIATVLTIDASRVVALTDAMQERGVVARSTDPTDRRRNLVSLTAAGAALFQRAGRIARRVEADLLGALTDVDGDRLRTLLRQALQLD